MMLRLKTISEQLVTEAVITKPDIPNTTSYWHGGNLDAYDDTTAQKNGRYEYGPGLYIINHYGTAQKYSKGSRKMYIVTVENGQDINDAKISLDDLNEFVDSYVIGSKRKEIKKRLAEYAKDGQVKAYLFNNMMVNEKAVKGTNTKAWREFLVAQGIDYELVHNPFGWGETMMVLYNMKKIKQIQQVGPKDKIEDYDMLMEAKQAGKLYHFTTIPALISILIDDTIDGQVSLTRDKNFDSRTKIIPTEAKITLDGDKLSNKYKIKPVNYGYEKDTIRLTGRSYDDFEDQMEERIDKDIKRVSDYIDNVEVREIDMWDYLDEDQVDSLDVLAHELGKKKEDLTYNDMKEFLEDRGIKIV